jgi:hypothetical protein
MPCRFKDKGKLEEQGWELSRLIAPRRLVTLGRRRSYELSSPSFRMVDPFLRYRLTLHCHARHNTINDD